MSSEGDTDTDTDTVSREVAWRVFAREYNDADLGFKEGEDERAPNYVATPTGAKINRLFVVGVLTEVERVGEDDLLRARVSDPTGAFVVYAGQYQPEAVSFFADAETPEFVAVVGKARTYEPDDSDDVYTSVRPEEVNVVDAETRDRWNVETARETLKRVEAVREYLRTGTTPETLPELHDLGEVVDHYGTDEAYLNELQREAHDVLTEVAGVEVGAEAGTQKQKPAPSAEEEAGVGGGDGTETQTRETADNDEGVGGDGDGEAGTEAGEKESGSEATDEGFEDIEQEDVGDWEWDEGQREEVEEEFGAEFESGSELAETETTEREGVEPEPDTDTEAAVKGTVEEEEREEEEEQAPTEDAGEDAGGAEDGAEESAERVVMDIIEEESGDDGVERSEILAKATESGIDEEVAESTLEDLLLEGMCYPTDGDRIKPI